MPWSSPYQTPPQVEEEPWYRKAGGWLGGIWGDISSRWPSTEEALKHSVREETEYIKLKLERGMELTPEEAQFVDTYIISRAPRPIAISQEDWIKKPEWERKAYQYAQLGALLGLAAVPVLPIVMKVPGVSKATISLVKSLEKVSGRPLGILYKGGVPMYAGYPVPKEVSQLVKEIPSLAPAVDNIMKAQSAGKLITTQFISKVLDSVDFSKKGDVVKRVYDPKRDATVIKDPKFERRARVENQLEKAFKAKPVLTPEQAYFERIPKEKVGLTPATAVERERFTAGVEAMERVDAVNIYKHWIGLSQDPLLKNLEDDLIEKLESSNTYTSRFALALIHRNMANRRMVRGGVKVVLTPGEKALLKGHQGEIRALTAGEEPPEPPSEVEKIRGGAAPRRESEFNVQELNRIGDWMMTRSFGFKTLEEARDYASKIESMYHTRTRIVKYDYEGFAKYNIKVVPEPTKEEGKTKAPSEYFLRLMKTPTEETKEGMKPKLRPVEGKFYPFEYKGIQLFAHRDVDNKKFWTVSEKQTGLRVAKSYNTKKEAIAGAKEEFDRRPIEEVKKAIKSSAEDIIPYGAEVAPKAVSPKAAVDAIKRGEPVPKEQVESIVPVIDSELRGNFVGEPITDIGRAIKNIADASDWKPVYETPYLDHLKFFEDFMRENDIALPPPEPRLMLPEPGPRGEPAVTPRYTARAVGGLEVEAPLKRPLTEAEIKTTRDASTRMGARWYLSFTRNWALSYQKKSGFPVYTEGVEPALRAGYKAARTKAEIMPIIEGWAKELTPEETFELDKYMKLKQAISELESVENPTQDMIDRLALYKERFNEISLNTTQLEIAEEYRKLSDHLFHNVAPKNPMRYISDYITHIEEVSGAQAPKPEFWNFYARDYKPWFQKHRSSVGKITYDYNIFELMEKYLDAAVFARYAEDLKPVEDLGKRLPGSPVAKDSPMAKFAGWIRYLKNGTPESDIGRAAERAREAADNFLTKHLGTSIPKDVSITSVLRTALYFGTMAFNPSPPIKNITQASHNFADMPLIDLIRGQVWMQTPEAKAMFRDSGVAAGFSPYMQRAYGKPVGASKLKKIIYYGLEIPTRVGLRPFSGVDLHLNRKGIWPAEMVRVMNYGKKYITGEMSWDAYVKRTDLKGIDPVISERVKPMLDSDKLDYDEWKAGIRKEEPTYGNLLDAALMLSYTRTASQQYIYQKENRPWIGRQGGLGGLGAIFYTWPTGKIEQQAEWLGRAYNLWKEGDKGAAGTQIMKEAKQIGFWVVLGLLATGAGIEGKRLARSWGLGWIPADISPAIAEAQDILKSLKSVTTGYKYGVRSLIRSLESYLDLYDPTSSWRLRYRKAVKQDSAYDKTLTMLGLPVQERKLKPPKRRDILEWWSEQGDILKEWERKTK